RRSTMVRAFDYRGTAGMVTGFNVMATRRVAPVSRKPSGLCTAQAGARDVEIVWRYRLPRRHHNGFTGPARPPAALMGSTSTRGSMMPNQERSMATTPAVLDGPQW